MKVYSFSFFVILLIAYLATDVYLADKAYGFSATGILGLFLLLIFIAHVLLLARVISILFIRIRSKVWPLKPVSIKWPLIASLLFVACFFLCREYSESFKKETRARADSIVNRLKEYKESKGVYPKSIDEIYGASVPTPALQNSTFVYEHKEGGEKYILSYNSAAFIQCSYESDEKEWFCGD